MTRGRITPQQARANYNGPYQADELIDDICAQIEAVSGRQKHYATVLDRRRVGDEVFESVKSYFAGAGWDVEEGPHDEDHFRIEIAWARD